MAMSRTSSGLHCLGTGVSALPNYNEGQNSSTEITMMAQWLRVQIALAEDGVQFQAPICWLTVMLSDVHRHQDTHGPQTYMQAKNTYTQNKTINLYICSI